MSSNSDRFFTRDFTREVYTPAGMLWLDDNNMMTVLLRNFPTLGGCHAGYWQRVLAVEHSGADELAKGMPAPGP